MSRDRGDASSVWYHFCPAIRLASDTKRGAGASSCPCRPRLVSLRVRKGDTKRGRRNGETRILPHTPTKAREDPEHEAGILPCNSADRNGRLDPRGDRKSVV